MTRVIRQCSISAKLEPMKKLNQLELDAQMHNKNIKIKLRILNCTFYVILYGLIALFLVHREISIWEWQLVILYTIFCSLVGASLHSIGFPLWIPLFIRNIFPPDNIDIAEEKRLRALRLKEKNAQRLK